MASIANWPAKEDGFSAQRECQDTGAFRRTSAQRWRRDAIHGAVGNACASIPGDVGL